MTEDELKAIEAQCRLSNRYVAVGDVLSLVAEVRRLRGLISDVHDQGSNTHNEPACPWCGGEQRSWPTWDCVGRRPIEHKHDCPAFTPDGSVR